MRRLLGALALVALTALPAAGSHPQSGPLLTIDPASLARLRAEQQPVLLIDVRPSDAYARGRLPGARSIPLDALVPRQREVAAGTIVVLYGTDTVDEAAPAARYLRGTGHAAVFVLEGGFAGWQARGLGVER
jgi:rhodanese-related sulfurtransferase